MAKVYQNFCPHLITSGIRLDSKVIGNYQHSRLVFLNLPLAPLQKHHKLGNMMPYMCVLSSSSSKMLTMHASLLQDASVGSIS